MLIRMANSKVRTELDAKQKGYWGKKLFMDINCTWIRDQLQGIGYKLHMDT